MHAKGQKPDIVELINKLKPGSLKKVNGKWQQAWLDDPDFGGEVLVDIPNGFASFSNGGTGAGGVSHDFAVYYPSTGGAILAHNLTDDRDSFKGELKFYQLKDNQLRPIDFMLPRFSCRELASLETKELFYANPVIAKLGYDPVLPGYRLPRKGTTISAYCDATSNRYNIMELLENNSKMSYDERADIMNAMKYPTEVEFTWNKKLGKFSRKQNR